MASLLCLAERATEVVTREELRRRVWPDCFVGDDALNSCISKLRRAFGGKGGGGAIFETVPKAGYRLVALPDRVVTPHRGKDPASVILPNGGSAPGMGTPDSPSSRTGRARSVIQWSATAAVVVAILVAGAGRVWRRGSAKPATPAYTKVVPVTSLPGLEVEPSPSPAGDRVAFSYRERGTTTWDLYVLVLGAGPPLQLTRNPGCDHHPAWSPDGREIAFARFYPEENRCDIRILPAMGGPERQLTECGGPAIFDLDWSADGRKLIYSVRPSFNEPSRLVALDLESLEKRYLTSPPEGSRGDFEAALSPDGHEMVLIRGLARNVKDLWIMAADGGEPRRLTFDGVDVRGISWAAGEDRVSFSSERGGSRRLWSVPPTGGAPSPLPLLSGDPTGPAVLPDGTGILFEQWRNEANIYSMELAIPDVEPALITRSSRWDWHPAISPGGDSMAFVSNRGGAPEIWTAGLAGGVPERRTEFGGSKVASPAWSPEGLRIAFEVVTEDNSDIWVLGTEGDLPRRLTAHHAEDTSPAWAADGRSIYFASSREGGWHIWRMPASGGAAERVTRGGGNSVRVSPDGRSLYFTRPTEPGLWTMPTAGGEEIKLLDFPTLPNRDNFAVDETAVYFVHPSEGGSAVLSRLDLRTSTVEDLAPLERLALFSGLALSPDRQRLYFTRVDEIDIDIALLTREDGIGAGALQLPAP